MVQLSRSRSRPAAADLKLISRGGTKREPKDVLEHLTRGRWVLNKAAGSVCAEAIISGLDLSLGLAHDDEKDQFSDDIFEPLHATAFYDHLECVKVLFEKVSMNIEGRDI